MAKEMNEYFIMREYNDVASEINDIFNTDKGKTIDKQQVLKRYNLTLTDVENEQYFNQLNQEIKAISELNANRMNELCVLLETKLNTYYKQYMQGLNEGLGCSFCTNVINYQCCLHWLPINEIDFDKKRIYLDCYNSNVDELFKTYIIMNTKLLIVHGWTELLNCNFKADYKAQNKVWLFAEIAVDAIFANSSLSEICSNPSYKYFYSLNMDGVNVMEQFRKLHQLVDIIDFFRSVYMFVHEHYYRLLRFKNYLY